MSGFLDEFGVANRSEAEAGELRSLDAKPLIVLTAELENSKGRIAAQNEIAALSPNSLHRVVPGRPTPPSWITQITPPPSPGQSTRSSPQCRPGIRPKVPDADSPHMHRSDSWSGVHHGPATRLHLSDRWRPQSTCPRAIADLGRLSYG